MNPFQNDLQFNRLLYNYFISRLFFCVLLVHGHTSNFLNCQYARKSWSFHVYFIHTSRTAHLASRVEIKDSKEFERNLGFINNKCKVHFSCLYPMYLYICKLSCKGIQTPRRKQQMSKDHPGTRDWLALLNHLCR